MTVTDVSPITFALALDDSERFEMLVRALRVCPDLDDFDLIWVHLNRLGFSMTWASPRIDAAIAEVRATS